MANAGIDQSNVSHSDGAQALLLPEDPDKSCEQLRQALKARLGVNVAVIINDSHGRAFRNGTVGVAIGVSGLPALVDLRGRPDLYGRRLQATDVGLADEIASAASLLMGQAAEGCPVVLVRGLDRLPDGGGAADLVRPKEKDLFRTVPPSALVDLMHRRWSVRRYTKDAVSDDIVLNILRAAVQAPSAHNRQPWRFTVIKSPIPKEKLATAMANRLREDRMRDGDNVADIERDAARSIARIAGAPLVVLVSMTLEDMDCYADAARSNAERAMAVQGTAMAVQNLLLSAEAFGLGASVMCAPLFCQDVVRRVLALPPQWEPQMLVTMGRPANQGRPSSRRRLNDVVHFIGDDE
jgi:coenzyme F420-0:L-glutamate ligase/coenzyme F420-1:gamma-L-glutamate ligase